MQSVLIAVRWAIVVAAVSFGTLLYASQELIPHSGATFVNGQFYAPGRHPGDGK